MGALAFLDPGLLFSARRASRRHRRARTPTLLQMEAVECGAAALGIVLGYFGRHVGLETLRVACGVSRDGSKASNIARAAQKYGLTVAAFRKEPADLADLPVPMILHWNFNHFVVLEGLQADRAYLNDPATGPRTVSREELDRAFTGVVLTFEKGPAFTAGGERRRFLPALGRRLAGFRSALALTVLAGLLLTIPGIVAPTFSRIFIDDVLVKGMSLWARPLLLVMGATALLKLLLTWMQESRLLRFEMQLALSTSAHFFWHVLRLPIGFFTQRAASDIAARVGLNDRLASLLSGDLATTVLKLVLLAFYATLMVQYDVVLTGVTLAIAVVNLVALRLAARKRMDLSARMLHDSGRLMATAMGGLQTIESLKAMGAESSLFTRWAGYHAKVVNAQQDLVRRTSLVSAVPAFLLSLNTALIIGLGGLRVMNGEMSKGMLLAFEALAIAFLQPINTLVSLAGTVQETVGSMRRVEDVLEAQVDPFAAAEPRAPAVESRVKLTGTLELRNVTFGHSLLERPLIEDFSLVLRPGMRVALIGGSGCGKTTVARLVSGLHAPWSGAVLFDGVPRADQCPAVLRGSLAVVDQDIFLFEGTVRDNLSMWNRAVPEATLVQAARDAHVHDDISVRPGGYESRVEEGGRNFSGGQRQRLELARALAAEPTILVLDEATSALDPPTEEIIDDNIRRRGCTCLIVAHRLSTIRDCDEILVMDGGKVVQRGTHEQMKDAPGPYQRLIGAA